MRGVIIIGSDDVSLAAQISLNAERIQESLTELLDELTNSYHYETDFVQVRDLYTTWSKINRTARERVLQRVIGSRLANFDGYRKCRQNLQTRRNGSPGQIYRGRRLV